MIIKKYEQFILERLGVPDGIVDSATNLYELIVSKFEQTPNEELEDNNGVCNFQIDLPININISDMKFDMVNFNITVHINNKFKEVDVASWGVSIQPTFIDDYKLYHDKSSVNSLDLMVNFISDVTNHFSDIAKYLRKDRNKTIGILSHELKHVYDKYMIGHELLEELIDYQTWAKTRTGFEEIDEFIYLLYVISKSESLVRPSEIAGYISAADITKSEFMEFLNDNRLYKELVKIKNWSYEELKMSLMNNMSGIRSRFDGIPEGESDEDVLDVVLNKSYEAIVGGSSKIAEDILGLNNAIKILTGRIKDEDIEFYNKFIDKRVFKNKDEFFLFWQKKLNFEGDKVIKKIIKLYDMCKDENVNPLMAKINDRVNGQCIVNPKLYNEVVLGTKSNDKVKYSKN
jgi:hypothetical protein